MSKNSIRSALIEGPKPNSKLLLILLLAPFLFLCGCASDAFLQPPENLPYAQEQSSDYNPDATRMPPLKDVE